MSLFLAPWIKTDTIWLAIYLFTRVLICKVQQEQGTGGLFNVEADKATGRKKKKKVFFSVAKPVRIVL